MKTMKYLLVGALLMGMAAPVVAQDGTAADVAAVKQLIKSKPADLDKQMKAYYGKNKKNADNLVAFGRAFYEAQDTANARTYANYALKANKQSGAAYILLGDVAALSEDGGAAAGYYEQAIYFDPKNPDAYKKYASVYRKIDPAGAVQKLEDLRTQRPDYPVDALIGHINYVSLRYSSAVEAFSKIPVNQLDRISTIEYAMSQYHGRQYDKSLDIVKAGLAKEPLNGTMNRIAMMNANELKKYDEALQFADVLFNKVDKDSVTLSDIDYQNWGKALSGNGQYEEAIAKFQQAIKVSEEGANTADLQKLISDSYKGLKDYPNAIASYKDYLAQAKEPSATEYTGLASLYRSWARSLEGDEKTQAYLEADKVYAELIEKYPDAEEYAVLQRGNVNASIDTDMSQALAKPYFEKLITLITAHEELDDTDKERLETSYRYLMTYNAQVAKDNRAALEFAKKIQELKPEDEGIQRLVELWSKTVK